MSYKRGFYLQAIEGEHSRVGRLVENLRQDPRHTDMQVVLDVETDHRYFSGWAMNLSPLLSRNREYKLLMSDMADELLKLPLELRLRSEIFFKQADSRPAKKAKLADSYPQQEQAGQKLLGYQVTHWPRFSEMQATPGMLTLCATLLNSPTSYQKLKGQGIFANENDLKQSLSQLRKAGCLVICQVNKEPLPSQDTHSQTLGAVPPLGFVERMRDFLNTRFH